MNTVSAEADVAEIRLIDLADILLGYQTRGRIAPDLNGRYAIIRGQDCDDKARVYPERAMRFSPSPGVDPETYLLHAGDILIQARGQSHLAYLVDTPLENTVASSTFYVLRTLAHAPLIPAYLAWWLNQPPAQAFFEREQGLSTVPFISKSTLEQTPVRLPSLEIQNRICALVALWQRERELYRLLLSEKENLVHAAARAAVFKSLNPLETSWHKSN
ncbi:MAG TPA: restriction endonuclease subunit S [Anaerolineales bacterium]|nr:restriction endonuclease subunit S [Anaerolineales bacterium]